MGKFINFLFGNSAEDEVKDQYDQRYADFVLGKDLNEIGSAPQIIVNEESAMQLSAVYSCVRVLAEDFASLPLHLYKRNGKNKEKAHDHPLYDLLYLSPNSEMTSFIVRETAMTNLLLWGNAYFQKIKDRYGNVLELWPLQSRRMRVERDANTNEILYYYTNSKGITATLTRNDVLHIPGLSYDGIKGLSPIALARRTLGIAKATEMYGAKFFENGARPGGVLEHPGKVERPDLLRDSWEHVYKGTANSHRVAVLEEGMKYHEIGIPPEDAQFLETRRFEMNEICRIYRVPPHMVGDLEKATFSNIEHQSIDYVVHTLRPWIVRWEQAIDTQLLQDWERINYYSKFNVDGLLRGDFQTRTAGYATARQNGWMSVNDIRELEDQNPISVEQGGDIYHMNGNMIPLTGKPQE